MTVSDDPRFEGLVSLCNEFLVRIQSQQLINDKNAFAHCRNIATCLAVEEESKVVLLLRQALDSIEQSLIFDKAAMGDWGVKQHRHFGGWRSMLFSQAEMLISLRSGIEQGGDDQSSINLCLA